MTRRRRSHRLLPIAGLTVLLTLSGGGGAFAFWSATASLQQEAAAARTGLSQTVHSDAGATPLAISYSADQLRTAGAVSITNTGDREAAYTLALRAESSTDSSLPHAISVAAAPVTDAAECGIDAVLVDAATGTLAGFAAEGRVAAGATVTLCVRTSMTQAAVTDHPGGEVMVAVQSRLEYAPYEAWRIASPSATFGQSVSAGATETPRPEPVTMTCSGTPLYSLQLSIPQNDPHQAQTSYRAFLARESTPGVRVPYPIGAMSGWWPTLQIDRDHSALIDYVASDAGGPGNTRVYLEMRSGGASGSWEPAGFGQIRIEPDAWNSSALYVNCGWK